MAANEELGYEEALSEAAAIQHNVDLLNESEAAAFRTIKSRLIMEAALESVMPERPMTRGVAGLIDVIRAATREVPGLEDIDMPEEMLAELEARRLGKELVILDLALTEPMDGRFLADLGFYWVGLGGLRSRNPEGYQRTLDGTMGKYVRELRERNAIREAGGIVPEFRGYGS